MSHYLLDTNSCIELLRRGPATPVYGRLLLVPKSDVSICSIVVGELEFGALRGRDPVQMLIEVRKFCGGYPSLPFNDRAAGDYARLRAHLAGVGTPIGSNDMMISAIALSLNLTVVTHNTRDFSRVPGLAIEDWQIP